MYAAVLDQTRQFFKITENPSVLAALTPARVRGNRLGVDAKHVGQLPVQSPRRKMALLASIVMGPAAVGLIYEPGDEAFPSARVVQTNLTSSYKTDAFSTHVESASDVNSVETNFSRRTEPG